MTHPTIGTVAMGDTEALKRIAKILPGDAETDTLSTATARLNAAIDIASGALSTRPAQEPVAGTENAPPCWWIDHGSHGQITQREDEAIAATNEGKSVVSYLSASMAQDPVAWLVDEGVMLVNPHDKYSVPLYAAPQPAHGTSATDPAPAPNAVTAGQGVEIDALAQEIRRVDGNHSLGAGALAEALLPFLTAALAQQTLSVQEGNG